MSGDAPNPEDEALEARVRAALDAVGAVYEALPCDPALADTAQFCAHYGVAPEDSANTLLVASKDTPPRRAACVVLATTRLDVNHRVRELLDARKLSFAGAEDTMAVTGMRVGGVTAPGLPAGLPLFIDARLLTRERVVIGGGSRSLKIRLAPEALTRLPGAQVVEGLAQARE
jgi:prolyl-tRNA editing enzyme YbaK/EbsC (Cys-tRNA(Pro) deacylase)